MLLVLYRQALIHISLKGFYKICRNWYATFIFKTKRVDSFVQKLYKSQLKYFRQGTICGIISIGVDPTAQCKGAGRLLLTALEKELRDQGLKELSLTTDYYNNEKTLKFYKSLNYEVLYDFIAYPNRRMYRLIKNL